MPSQLGFRIKVRVRVSSRHKHSVRANFSLMVLALNLMISMLNLMCCVVGPLRMEVVLT